MKKPKHLRLALLAAALLAGGAGLPAFAQAPAPARPPLTPLTPLATPVPAAPAPAAPRPAPAPVAVPDPDQEEAVKLVAEIAQQQAKIVENQRLIDTKMATVTENLRIARIYVSRGGGGLKK